MEGLKFRFAAPADAGDFTRWAVTNTDIPARDIKAGMKENNPTSTVLVIEHEGTPVLYVPLYCLIRLAYLGFNPEADAEMRLAAMEKMLEAVKVFAATYSINEITTLTKSHYNVAAWARGHGFSPEDRELYVAKVIETE